MTGETWADRYEAARHLVAAASYATGAHQRELCAQAANALRETLDRMEHVTREERARFAAEIARLDAVNRVPSRDIR